MNEVIKVDFDPKAMRLVMQGPIWLVDILRSFPSRRFMPKTKAWHMPLTRQNVNHWLDQKNRGVKYEMSPGAIGAMLDFDKLTAPPTYPAFPANWFDKKKWKPLPHQGPMLDRGWGLKGYGLVAAMGTGKTFVTVNMALARHKFAGLKYLAVISPATLQRTWEREFAKYGNERDFTARRLKTKDPGFDGWMRSDPEKLHVLLIGVEGLGISEKFYQAAIPFFLAEGPKMAVCDEASRIKNPKALRSQRAVALGQTANWTMFLNGTPIAKGIQDLWSQYEFLDPNIIGSGDYWAFKTRYVVMGGYENKQIVGYSNVDELMKLIQPYSLEVDKSVLKLLPKLPKTIYVEPTSTQRALFKRILTSIGEGPKIKIQNVLERMLRLQQVIGGFEPQTDENEVTTTTPLDENPKLEALLRVVEDHGATSKFIIWARYVPEIELLVSTLRQKFGDEAVVHYYGGTSPEDRAIAEDRYCNDPTCRVVVGNPAAAGLGLTFIGGEVDAMVYYSGTFAYIDRAQSEDRSHRIGQSNTVPIIDLVMEDSIDELIVEAIKEKMGLDEFVKKRIAEGTALFNTDGTPILDTLAPA